MMGFTSLIRYYLLDIWKKPANSNEISKLGPAILEVARGTIGWGEEGGNNKGPKIELMRAYRGPRGPWCAAAVSYWIHTACNLLGLSRPVPRIHNAKRLFKACKKAGRSVEIPQPGDIVCWHRGAKNAKTGHIGVVSRVNLEEGLFWSIEGNKGTPPAAIDEFKHALGEGGLRGFARLP